MKTEAKIGVMHLQAVESPGLPTTPEARRGREGISPSLQRQRGPMDTLLGIFSLQNCEKSFLLL